MPESTVFPLQRLWIWLSKRVGPKFQIFLFSQTRKITFTSHFSLKLPLIYLLPYPCSNCTQRSCINSLVCYETLRNLWVKLISLLPSPCRPGWAGGGGEAPGVLLRRVGVHPARHGRVLARGHRRQHLWRHLLRLRHHPQRHLWRVQLGSLVRHGTAGLWRHIHPKLHPGYYGLEMLCYAHPIAGHKRTNPWLALADWVMTMTKKMTDWMGN